MYFLIGLCIIFIVILVASNWYNKIILERKWLALKDRWGRLKEGPFNFYQIEKYRNKNDAVAFHRLSEQTLSDIDFDELFRVVDRTSSCVGQQYLYDKLQNPSNDINALQQLDRCAVLFANSVEIREKVQKILFSLQHNDAYNIQSLLGKTLAPRPWWFKYLIASPLLIIVLIVIGLKNPVAIICLALPLVFNSIIHFYNKSTAFSFTTSFPQLNTLIVAAQQLSRIDPIRSEEAEASAQSLKSFQKKYQFLRFGSDSATGGDLNVIGYYFTELLKGFTLVEVFVFYNLIKELENKQRSIETLFKYIGEIDSALSTASLRAGILETCVPEFIRGSKKMEMVGVYHPLIYGCIPNSLAVNAKSILITGSNMSGKTTFLRAVLLNSLLAQTIYTCFARSFVAPIVRHYSSIRIQDNVMDGKSLYFQEVGVMEQLVRASKSDHHPSLFILDEVFKGTNTIERIAASKAILSYLNENSNIVLVATHDYELNELLKSEYDLYHFTEVIEGNDMKFDHTIKAGQHETRNAIRVLELSNYPTSVVKEARELAYTFANTLKHYQNNI
jgi:hypothetical protein